MLALEALRQEQKGYSRSKQGRFENVLEQVVVLRDRTTEDRNVAGAGRFRHYLDGLAFDDVPRRTWSCVCGLFPVMPNADAFTCCMKPSPGPFGGLSTVVVDGVAQRFVATSKAVG